MKNKTLRFTIFLLKYTGQCIKFIHFGKGWPKFVYWVYQTKCTATNATTNWNENGNMCAFQIK